MIYVIKKKRHASINNSVLSRLRLSSIERSVPPCVVTSDLYGSSTLTRLFSNVCWNKPFPLPTLGNRSLVLIPRSRGSNCPISSRYTRFVKNAAFLQRHGLWTQYPLAQPCASFCLSLFFTNYCERKNRMRLYFCPFPLSRVTVFVLLLAS